MRGLCVLIGISFVFPMVAGCTDYVVVTVDARPAVHGARSVTVALSNAGTTREDSLSLDDQAFPVTFSISAPGRTGDLAITVEATDEGGLVVGRGSAGTTLAAADATVMLDPTDFVVNTDYAGDQFPSGDFEAHGFQLAALPDGTWTVVFRDGCAQQNSCNVFARRFDQTGKPVSTQAAAGTNAFVVTARPTTLATTPAIASGATATVAVWDFYDVGAATTSGVACRTIDAAGALGADQVSLAGDAADVVSVAAVPGGNFVATWRTLLPNAGNVLVDTIRMATIKPDCSTPGAVTVAQGATATDFLHRGSVASSGERVLLAWITNGALHARVATSQGALVTGDLALIPATATEQVEQARVAAASGGGFVLAVRWIQKNAATGPGRIELFRINADGALVGTPTLVTDRSATDFASSEAFGIASRGDGSVMLAWHTCGALGDDSMCGVFGRILKDTGPPVTDSFVIPTTTTGDQTGPSVVGLPDGFVVVWADGSARPPDTAGQAVRARIIYPPGS